ncbi:MAG: DUF2461 domain-containing protein [Bacteroidota bacterium]
MSYFNPSFPKFFKDLSKNNSTEWFNENRKTYEKEVKKPFADFVAEMIGRIQQHEPEVQIKPSDAITRINKDIRFSKDKTPYNTHVAANISVHGKKDKSYPGFYFQLSSEGITLYGGAYMVENATLENIRNHIAQNLKGFSQAYNDTLFKNAFGSIQGEQNKRIPPAFQAVLEKEPLIANKQFFYTATLKPDLILSDTLPDKLIEYYLAGKKVNDFLKQAWTN